MKSFVKIFVPVAVAAIALISCQKEIPAPSAPEEIQITVQAVPQDLTGENTKTYINSSNAVLWGTGEYMQLGVITNDGEKDNAVFAKSSAASADASNGSGTAEFQFSIAPANPTASEFTYVGLYPFSAAVTSSNTNPANYKVNLPAIQNATADSYDPKAYIMVAEPMTIPETVSKWTASYRRATALNKITLKNLSEPIKRVKITVPDGQYLAGGRHIDLTTGDSGDIYSQGGRTNTIEVKYETAISGASIDVWFTSWEVDVNEGQQLTVVAYSAEHTFTRTITALVDATHNGIHFAEGKLNSLSINMSSATQGDNTELEEGNYVILAKDGENYYALKAEQESGKERLLSVEYNGGLVAYNGDADIIWSLTKSGNSFIFENSSKYLGYKGSNNESYWLAADSEWTETNYLLDVTAQATAGQYYVTLHSNSSRYLSKNSSAAFFAFYGNTTQKADIVFVPAKVDARQAVTLSFADDAINKTTANYSEFTGQAATADPDDSAITSNITYAMTGDAIGTITSGSTVALNGNEGTATVTATFAGDAAYRPAEASYTITVASASGPEYVLVSSATDVVEGDYVITWNNTYYLPNENTGKKFAVGSGITVASDKLTNTVTDAMVWNFAGDNTNGFTISAIISNNTTHYLQAANTSDGISVAANASTPSKWTVSVDGTYGMLLRGNDGGTRNAAVYNNADWRYYATGSNYTGVLRLYKLEDNTTWNLKGIAVKTAPTTIIYHVDDNFDPAGLVITATYEDAAGVKADKTVDIAYSDANASSFSFSPSTSTALATENTSVTISYTDGSLTKTADQAITVKAAAAWVLSSITVKTGPSTTSYTVGDFFDPTGLVITASYNDSNNPGDSKTEDIAYADATAAFSFSPSTSTALTVANTSVTISYTEGGVTETADQAITVVAAQTIATALSAPGTYNISNVAVYGVKGNALILGDASGKIYAYSSGHNLNVGDVRTVSGSTIWYNSGDVYEFDAPTFSGSGTTTINHGSAVEFADNAATLQTETGFASTGSGAAHTAVYVHAIGDQSGRNITTSNGKVLYLSAAESATDGKTVEVYGYVYAYSASHTNFNFLATSIEEYVDPNAKVITALKSSITGVSADGVTNASESGVYSLTNATDSDVTATPDGTVVTAASVSGGTLTYTVAANTGSARSGSVTLAVDGGNSFSVTISQAAGSSSTTHYYEKVTSTDGITSGGSYIIVANSNRAMVLSATANDMKKPASAAVTISNNKIESNATTDAYAVTLTSTSNGYTISYVINNTTYYLWYNSSTNFQATTSAPTKYFTITAASNYGTFVFGDTSTASASTKRGLVYRAGNYNIFGAYSIGNPNGTEYFNLDLYKLN
ncbi:MAG: hypothetical protein K6E37_10370 [Bacteroidales bacterium]|nr:hypothetical protein [Bacteroidales bacterium]